MSNPAKNRIFNITFASLVQSPGIKRGKWLVGATFSIIGCLIWFLLPTGCNENRELRANLDRLEVMIEKEPEAAMAALDSIPQTSLVDQEDMARYILLQARAQYRCYIDETNDSLISIAVDFFTEHPSISPNGISRKELALYQQGVIQENDENYLMALDSFLKAEAEAIAQNDHYFLGYIYRHLCLLYENINAGKESVYYGKKSYEEFQKAGSEPNIAYAVSELGYAYGVYCQYDSALIWSDICLDLPYSKLDSNLREEALRNAGMAAAKLDRPHDAVKYFTQIQILGEDAFLREDAWHLARAYQAIGKGDDAYTICRQYLADDTISGPIPYEVLYARGDIEGAYHAIKKELDRRSLHANGYARQNLTRALAEFREQEISNEVHRHNRDRAEWILGSCLFVAVTIILLMAMSRKIKRSRKDLTSLMTTMETLNEELRSQIHAKDSIISEKESENAQARQSYYTLLESQIQQIDEMTSLFREPTSTTENRRLFKRITHLKENFCDPKFLAKMEQEINTFHNNIVHRLRAEFPGMKEEDVRLFLYQVCGFSGRTITFLTGEELTALYPRRSRLKARINRSQAPSRSEFLSYFS